jgi:serine/threonine protein kinase
VARAAFSSRESQTHGLVLGTLNYFPPEILAGGEPTPAVDIYGLGLTLWECATGKDWGSPQVHKHRFERRVEQRLAEIGDDFRSVVPILRRILQWDPGSRPPGDEVERLLLEAADACSGPGLRTWAREVVPPILAQRKADAQTDELVGKTLSIDGGGGGEPQRLDSLSVELPAKQAPMEAETFNDLAPPAAVRRYQQPAESKPIEQLDTVEKGLRPAATTVDVPLEDDRKTQLHERPGPQRRKRSKKKGSSQLRTLALLGVASLIGAVIGLALFSVVLLVVWALFL